MNFPRNPTDLVSFEAPRADNSFQKVYDNMVTTHRYDKNTKNSNKWADAP